MGIVSRHTIEGTNIQPDRENVFNLNVESAIVSISMDESNIEGLVGTEAGCIHYVNVREDSTIPIVSSNNKNQDNASLVQCDPGMNQLFFTNCGSKSDEVKIYTIQNCDLVHTF